MDCRQFRQLVMTTRLADRTQADLERLAAHELHCESCKAFGVKAEGLDALLAGVPAAPAPSDFTRQVMGRISQAQEARHEGWYERVFGSLRPPAPAFGFGQAVAVAALALMVVSLGLWVGGGRSAVLDNGAPTVAVAGSTAGQVIQMDKAFVEEVVARHQGAAAMQPLSDDESMRLVSY